MNNALVIIGPTASGKTKFAIELAKRLDGEIVSADSMQVYKYMDIGTAKPDETEREGIKHYLIDEVDPCEEFSVARYQELAVRYIDEILSKGKLPIIAGGTGLYINSLIYNINFTETVSDWTLRERLKKEAEEKGNAFLHEKLREIDPEAAEKIHVNDLKRIIRSLEVYEYTRKPISYHQEISRQNPPKYRFIIIGLSMDRKKLYDRINKRVDLMLQKGLVQEVKSLMERGFGMKCTSMQGLGYKEIAAFLRGEITLDEAIYIIKRDTRHYAKRQITWFKRIEGVFWLNVDEFENTDALADAAVSYVKGLFPK